MTPSPPSTAAQLAALIGATVEGDGGRAVRGLASLRDAGPEQVSFLANPRYTPQLAHTRAGTVLLAPDVRCERTDICLLRHPNPNRAFTALVELFSEPEPRPEPGIHPSACVHPSAQVHPEAAVGPGCVVEAEARIGAGAVLRAQVFVGQGASVGPRSYLHAGCVLERRVEVGADCILHAGVVLGAEGFGFEPSAEFATKGWRKVPQCGTVVVEDEVEIGANCTVDRARFGATRIGRGSKLDNLVHVAHNVVLEPRVLLVAQVGIAGSARIGAASILAGQVGVAGHVEIAPGTRVGGQSGISKDITKAEDYFGTPARPLRDSGRDLNSGRRLQVVREQMAALKARVAALEKALEERT